MSKAVEVRSEAAIEREVLLQEPMPHQQGIILDRARFKVLICGRRFGKTSIGRIMALVGHGPTCTERRGVLSGAYVWWVMPTLNAARETWDAFEYALRDVWVKKNATERFFDLPGGGRLQVKSSDEPDSLRGAGLDGVVLDELKDHNRKTWEILRPALSDKHGWLLGMGTPGPPDQKNLAYYLFTKAESQKGWRRWQEPSSANPLLTTAELADMRTELGSFGFQRECLVQFVTAEGGLCKKEWFQFYTAAPERLARFVTVDLAISTKTWADWTVAVAWGRDERDGRLYVLDLLRVQVEGPRVVSTVAAFMERHRATQLWTAEFGPLRVLVQEAKERGLPVREVQLPQPAKGQSGKVTRAEPLFAAIESGRVLFPGSASWLNDTITELCAFPDPNMHDDQVDALSLAVAVAPALPPSGSIQRSYPKKEGPPNGGGWRIGR